MNQTWNIVQCQTWEAWAFEGWMMLTSILWLEEKKSTRWLAQIGSCLSEHTSCYDHWTWDGHFKQSCLLEPSQNIRDRSISSVKITRKVTATKADLSSSSKSRDGWLPLCTDLSSNSVVCRNWFRRDCFVVFFLGGRLFVKGTAIILLDCIWGNQKK